MNVRAGGQSSGMGVGWDEYVASTINQSVVVGAWLVG
jgi:hypothetical protein